MRYFDPIRELTAIKREFDRIFEPGIPGQNYFERQKGNLNLNVNESGNTYNARVLAPGVDPDSIELSVHQNKLTIIAKRKELEEKENRNWHRRERRTGEFSRTVTLPDEVDASAVKAEYRNGILTIALPKAESARPKQIHVKVA